MCDHRCLGAFCCVFAIAGGPRISLGLATDFRHLPLKFRGRPAWETTNRLHQRAVFTPDSHSNDGAGTIRLEQPWETTIVAKAVSDPDSRF